MNDEGILGVLGGMGPNATINFMEMVTTATPAERDQDHIEMLVYNDPKIPDRNTAILEGTESPLPRLQRNAKRLEKGGADLLAMPCNTAHYYYDDIADIVDIEFIHIIRETVKELQKHDIKSAGLLATTTVMETDIYREEFENSGIGIHYPNNRENIMDSIYAIKKGNYSRAEKIITKVINQFEADGVDAIIIGCSDISVLSIETTIPTFDPTKILSSECVTRLSDIDQQ